MIEKSFSIFLSLFFALGGPACYSEPAVAHISAPDRNTLVQIAFGSCISDPSSPIWDSILATDPDVFILLGDTVYLEHEDLGRSKRIRARFHRLFSEPGFARLRKAIPTYAIWDDHDFGPNDGDSQFIHADVSRMVFRDFWSLPPTILDDKGGIYGKLHLPNVTVLLTDNRSYRRNPVSGKASQLFGPRQLAWIESELVQPRTPLVVIASGNQFLSDDTEPSEEGLWQYPA